MDFPKLDLATWTGIAFAIVALIDLGKKFAEKLVSGREQIIAVVLGLGLGIAAKAGGYMTFGEGWKGWAYAAGGGLLTAIFSQLVHDKAWDPLKDLCWSVLKKFFAAKEAAPPTSNDSK